MWFITSTDQTWVIVEKNIRDLVWIKLLDFTKEKKSTAAKQQSDHYPPQLTAKNDYPAIVVGIFLSSTSLHLRWA